MGLSGGFQLNGICLFVYVNWTLIIMKFLQRSDHNQQNQIIRNDQKINKILLLKPCFHEFHQKISQTSGGAKNAYNLYDFRTRASNVILGSRNGFIFSSRYFMVK